MGRIIDFPVPLSTLLDMFARGEIETADEVLLQEGLDLLAFYTAIGDKQLRLAIKELVERLALASARVGGSA